MRKIIKTRNLVKIYKEVQEKRASLAQRELEYAAAVEAEKKEMWKERTPHTPSNTMAFAMARTHAYFACGYVLDAKKELQEVLAKSATIRLLSSTLCRLRKTPHPLG
jgi:hypothetical protein